MLSDRSVVIVSGPGGVGKGTIVRALLERDDRLWLSQSWTTRERRPGEPADAYRFVDRATFESAVRDELFLEWVEFLDYLVGTPLPDPPAGCDALLEIDVHGACKVAELVIGVVLIFVDAPSVGEQRARMLRRGDSESAIDLRLAKADSERALAAETGYTFVINDDLERAIEAVEELIAADRLCRGGEPQQHTGATLLCGHYPLEVSHPNTRRAVI